MSDLSIKKELLSFADKKKAAFLPSFFKCGKGEYGEGDQFIGVTVPQIRVVAKHHKDATLKDIRSLLCDPIHECRLLALILLVQRFQKADETGKKAVFDFYLRNKKYVNNWDLVDSSAYQIVGDYLLERNRSLLDDLARSDHLWTQRIAMVATFAFIRKGQLEDTFRLSALLLSHEHDLMHKAVGWMLREAGKRDKKALTHFLKNRYATMPRTMLRYAIEKFPEAERKRYLQGKI